MVAPTAGAAHLAEERAEDALGLLPVNLCVTVQDAPETGNKRCPGTPPLSLLREAHTCPNPRSSAQLQPELCAPCALAARAAPLVGVLALQGGFHEHKVMLGRLGAR
eukprot:605294-Prymnesium_polylepis.1